MPFTPLHFGPSACLVLLPFRRSLDPPTFVLVNVAMDLEPLSVIVLDLNYPLHGYAHTFLGAALVGALTGLIAYNLRRPITAAMRLLWPLPYIPHRHAMILSGVLGALFHVLLDAPLYPEMRPFWPLPGNPFYAMVTYRFIVGLCVVGFLLTVILYTGLWLKQRSSAGPRQR